MGLIVSADIGEKDSAAERAAHRNSRSAIVVGLVGGVASGKSTVARELERLGAVLLDADQTGHQALANAGICRQVVDAFGDGILDRDGNIDRKALGHRVFGDADSLKALTDITHPWIGARLREELEKLLNLPEPPVVVLDVSLLLESGNYEKMVDLLVFIDADEDQRRQRVRKERGWPPEQVALREAHQMPLMDKRTRTSCVIENNSDLKALIGKVRAFWKTHIEPKRGMDG